MTAANGLARCVEAILCGLSRATQNALINLINGYLIQLDLARASLEAELAVLNIATAPIALANTVAQQALAQIKAGANLIPLDIIGTCFEVGVLNETISENIDALAVDVNIIASDLQRLVSARDEVEAALDNLVQSISLFRSILETFSTCEELGLTE